MSEFSRPCVECGKMHDTGAKDRITQEVTVRTEKCYDCLMGNGFCIEPIVDQVKLDF